jgi:hypothetical protein
MNDVDALARALVYCDVVVTERQGADLIHRSGLDEAYQSAVMGDLADLTLHLL